MAKVKSPNYPRMSLGEALTAARKAFDKDNRNKMSQAALAKHLGHDSLSGPALGKIGALRAYGLIEGSGDELRISDDAITAMMAPEGSPERAVALAALAAKPKLFQEIRGEFTTPPSVENLKFWLVKRKFASDAAETAAKSYLGTLRLVAGRQAEYNSGEKEAEQEPPMPAAGPETRHILDRPSSSIQPPTGKSPMLQEVFNLDEGPVTLSFPSALSQESYEELKDQLALFLRRAQRRALWNDPAYLERRKAEVARRATQNEDDEAAN
jgi:hypothetical protein